MSRCDCVLGALVLAALVLLIICVSGREAALEDKLRWVQEEAVARGHGRWAWVANKDNPALASKQFQWNNPKEDYNAD